MRTHLRRAAATLRAVPTTVQMAVLTTLLVVGGPASTARAAGDPYTGSVDTTCDIATPTISPSDTRPVVEVTVGAVGNVRPTGHVRISYQHDSRTIRTQQTRYDGGTMRITGPALDQQGRYSVHVSYHPRDHSVYQGCSAAARVARVGTDVSPAHGGHGGHAGHHGDGPTGVEDANGNQGGHGHDGSGTETAADVTGVGTTEGTSADQGHGRHGLLPNTGSPVTLGLLVTAVGLVGVGLTMMSQRLGRRRRRRRLSW